tara:strand:- start:142 stop:573 length:432 start_codon:yes stop_codon:yes gene_type:complete
MARTLDMTFIRYLNLFEKITKIRIQHCFEYNSTITFVVPEKVMARAIGEGGKNIKRLSEILGKRVKVISSPLGKEKGDIEKFILAIVHPIKFKGIDLNEEENSIVVNAGRQSKAALIGRNKARLEEMKNILNEYFGIKEVRIA